MKMDEGHACTLFVVHMNPSHVKLEADVRSGLHPHVDPQLRSGCQGGGGRAHQRMEHPRRPLDAYLHFGAPDTTLALLARTLATLAPSAPKSPSRRRRVSCAAGA